MLKINGIKKILGHEIKVIEGGFGPGQKVLFDTQIAEIHNMKNSEIRKSINRLLDKGRLKKGIDFIDVLQRGKEFITFDLTDIYAKQAITQAKNIFVLSERGYTKLIKSMDDDTSWDVMEEIVDNYFTMRQVLNSIEQEKKELVYKIYKGGEEAVIASEKLRKIEVDEATKPLQKEIEDKNIQLQKTKEWYSIKRVAQIVNASWKDFNWRLLKLESKVQRYEVKKVFDANYGKVNAYHINVWKAVYPETYKELKEQVNV